MDDPELHRKFGVMPDWAKSGPISLWNYDIRAEQHGVARGWGQKWPFLSRSEAFKATADEGEWDRYFRDHLGGFPATYKIYRDGVLQFMNMPEADPQDFDPSYQPRARMMGQAE